MKGERDLVLIFLAALVGLADFGHAQKDSVLQLPAEMTIQVAQSATLHCNFSTSYSNPYIFWYQQRQTRSPQMLLWVSKYKARVDSGRFSSVLSAEDSQVLLHVRDAELRDSAAYFCALSPHWCPQLAAVHRNMGGNRQCSAGRNPYGPESMLVSLSNSWMTCLSQVTWVCSASPVGGFACPYLSQRALGSVDGELTAALSVLHSAVSWVPWTFQVLLLVALQGCRGLQRSTDTILPQSKE
ncbi:uncharacterized protein M6G45_014152 [Spheniscus humboldti]